METNVLAATRGMRCAESRISVPPVADDHVRKSGLYFTALQDDWRRGFGWVGGGGCLPNVCDIPQSYHKTLTFEDINLLAPEFYI